MRFLLICIILLPTFVVWAQDEVSTAPNSPKKLTLKRYEYLDRDHTYREIRNHLSFAYGAMVVGYVATQYNTIKNNGSFRNYGNNAGKVVMDKDNPIWNLVGHPYTGSQTYLFYRALGYEKIHAFQMSFWTSTLFEFTIEIYTEKASVQDIYQTPVLGSALGYAFERTSMFLLNNDSSTILKFLAYVINPMTFFGFTEVETVIYPEISKNRQSLNYMVTF